jgi:hypothetical protein
LAQVFGLVQTFYFFAFFNFVEQEILNKETGQVNSIQDFHKPENDES